MNLTPQSPLPATHEACYAIVCFLLCFSSTMVRPAVAAKPIEEPVFRPIGQAILQFKPIKRPFAKNFAPQFGPIGRISSEKSARRVFTAKSIAQLRPLLDFAKEDLVIISSVREVSLKHQIHKAKTGTTVICFASRLISESYTHQVARFFAVARNVTVRFFPRPDWERRLAARLILNKTSYVLSNNPQKTDLPLVDFEIEIENTSKRDLRIKVGGGACQLMLTLNGPGVVNNIAPGLNLKKLKIYSRVPLTIPAGKKRRLSLGDFLQGQRGYHRWANWTKSGKYTLHLSVTFMIGPELTKSARLVRIFPRQESFDFPSAELTVLPPARAKKPKTGQNK